MHWLIDSWRTLLPTAAANVLLAVVAVLCGSIVGTERQRREKPAGLRTLILVCLGSTLFTMASLIFNTASGDSGRVAAQIVTGIGFLGAGAILHERRMVSGMTTAATIWVTAAIGMIAGAGYAGPALGTSLLVRLVLVVIGVYETHIVGELRELDVELDFDPSAGRTRVRLERVLVDYNVAAAAAEWENLGPELSRLRLRLHLPRRHLRELLGDLVAFPEVQAVRESEPTALAGR
ncbi:MAG: putative Mg2+ transporter-C (MgtC) family protein [Chthoniobacter sp.]|jgi:putative Mg2+ transporter-C (MgtC) family protein|nr:putative Mg2+ transporter-C (MgtC) family protein [Chthoniobacter sp.]